MSFKNKHSNLSSSWTGTDSMSKFSFSLNKTLRSSQVQFSLQCQFLGRKWNFISKHDESKLSFSEKTGSCSDILIFFPVFCCFQWCNQVDKSARPREVRTATYGPQIDQSYIVRDITQSNYKHGIFMLVLRRIVIDF